MSATWDTSSGQQPVIGFANLATTARPTLLAVPIVAAVRTVPAVRTVAAVPVAVVEQTATAATVEVVAVTQAIPVVAVSQSTEIQESSPASVVSGVDLSSSGGSAMSSSASGVNSVPVILPVGVTSLNQANMNQAVPVRVGSEGSNTIGIVNQAGNPVVQQVPTL